MSFSKKELVKYGLTFTLIVVTVVLTMVFTKGTVQTGEHIATLDCYYDNGKEQFNYTYTFSFELIKGSSYPLTTEIIPLGDIYKLWIQYVPKIHVGYDEQMFIKVSITDLVEDNVKPVPVIGNFSLEIKSLSGKGLDLVLPASGLEEDYRGQKWIDFKIRLPYETNVVLSLLFVVGILWVTETIPLVATSFLIPVIGVTALNLSVKGLLAPFAEPVIFLFLGGFVISKAMNRTGLDKWISLNIVRISPNKPKILMLLMMTFSAILSMFMSNTATAATMIPIATAVSDKLKTGKKEEDVHIERYGKALILGIAYSASLGGIGSAIGTPANPIAIALLRDYAGVEISFIKWFVFGLPIVFVMLPIMWLYIWAVYKPQVPSERIESAKMAVKKEIDNMGPLNKKQIYVLFVFLTALTLWFLERPLKKIMPTFSSSVVAVIAAIMIFVPNVLQDKDINDLNWNALLIFGGGLVLGVVMTESGTGDMIAFSIANFQITSKLLFLFIITLLSVVLTFVASNTGAAAIIVPLVIPLGLIFDIDPVLLAVIAAIGSSIDFMLPQGTPPTMIAYSTGKYTVKEMVKIGFLIVLLGTVLLAFVFPFFWKLIGVVYF
ncbi:MAG: DASS family sodium-coupled anion symporter [Candidatus Heimdallarchaeum endolithica]|uniref:DASS family sodium-coupled anion symporter n=1 Tax=Candidatus Heimdallarchaeum endolithica TaxID=2876572 RepID=A0A9Y1FNM6_9ARCH|nr:MAG: DASS family sodium-coupled anion symporter [Candidatus Heimdallarchaeum endolithica]